jgi:mannosyltransferase
MSLTSTIDDTAEKRGAGCVRLFRIGLAMVLLLGLLPRVYGLSERSLWFDEAFSWRLIQFPFFDMLNRVGADTHPPLYFIILKLWAELFGDSAWALRSLSVLFGLTTIWGTYLFTSQTFTGDLGEVPEVPVGNTRSGNSVSRGQAIGLFGAALVALSAFQIRYSWEMRMYALAAALAVFSSWAMVRALRTPRNTKGWLLYGWLALLLGYTHYYGLLTLASQGVFLLLFLWRQAGWKLGALFRQRHFWYAALTEAFVILAWLPWLGVFLRQRAAVKSGFWTVRVSVWDVPELLYQMFLRPEYLPAPPRWHVLWTFAICIVALCLLARKSRPREWCVICLGVGPVAFSLLASAWDVPIFSLRYFLPTHVFLLVGLAALVWKLRSRAERAMAAAGLLCLFAGVGFEFWEAVDLEHKPGSRGAAAFLASQRDPTEPVIASMPFFYFSLLHYAPARSGYYLYNDGSPMPVHFGTAAMTASDFITAQALKEMRSRRVWVVDLAGGFLGYRPLPVPSYWIAQRRWVFADVFYLGNLILIEYAINRPAGENLHHSGK